MSTPRPRTAIAPFRLVVRLAFAGSIAIALPLALAACAGEPSAASSGAVPSAAVPSAHVSAVPTMTAVPTSTAAASALQGGWSVQLTSESASINPDMLDAAQRQRMFFDHAATVDQGRVVVRQRAAASDHPLKDPAAGLSLEGLVLGEDWPAWKTKTTNEGATEGATEFRFVVTVGDVTHELTTAKLDEHAALKTIAEALRQAAGAPQ